MDSGQVDTQAPGSGGWGGETRQNHTYKPFVRGALVTVLTVGCTLGAVNLAVMGFGADLSAVWVPLIQAHGYAQVFGWVGLFIMGIAYHLVPRFYLRPLTRPQLVLPSFALVVSGLVLRFAAQPFAAQYPAAGWLLVLSAALGLAGMTLFAWAMYDTMRRGADRFGTTADRLYIGAGFAWLWLGHAATLALMVYMAANSLDAIPASLNAPYLRAVLSGAVVTTILGFTLRTVPHMLGLRPPPSGAMRAVFAAYTIAVLAQIAAEGGTGSGVLASAGAGLELAALLGFVVLSGVFNISALRTTALAKRNPWPERFVRAAYFWLLAASSLNFAYSLSALAGRPAPHAFVASYHHALTVGFISMMILGMSMRLVPAFIGTMNRQTGLAAALFVLINLGNTMRVVSEAMAHRYGGGFFAAMGLSGFIEVVGLSLYAIALWKALGQPSYGQKPVRRREAAAPQASPGLPSTQ
jgi:uncharacterized protein involved in response to NO